MINVALVISYDGSCFAGFQRQTKQRTVQGVLEESLAKLLRDKPKIIGAGRTDAGVHAIGQAVNFYTHYDLPERAYLRGLNSLLPADLKVRQMFVVPDDFHARKSAKAKEYHYWLRLSPTPSPIGIKAWQIYQSLDLEAMVLALKYFRGEHDFSAFRSTGSSAKSTIRTIYNTAYSSLGNYAVFSLIGNGFLYNMVRIIMGTLLDVGTKKLLPQDIPAIIAGCERKKAGRTAPPEGLYLYKVYYNSLGGFCGDVIGGRTMVEDLCDTDLDIKGYFT